MERRPHQEEQHQTGRSAMTFVALFAFAVYVITSIAMAAEFRREP